MFTYSHVVRAPIVEAFEIFSDPRNLELLTPRWLCFRLTGTPGPVGVGSRFRYRIAPFGAPVEWVAAINDWNPPHGFSDEQVSGPYASWRHEHSLLEFSGGTEVRDVIEYRLRGGRLGPLADRLVHRRFLEYLFAYRSRRLDELLGGRGR